MDYKVNDLKYSKLVTFDNSENSSIEVYKDGTILIKSGPNTVALTKEQLAIINEIANKED